jgi:hypothetical protein
MILVMAHGQLSSIPLMILYGVLADTVQAAALKEILWRTARKRHK